MQILQFKGIFKIVILIIWRYKYDDIGVKTHIMCVRVYVCVCVIYYGEEFILYKGNKYLGYKSARIQYTAHDETKCFSYSSPRASSNASSCGRLSPIPAVLGEPDWTPTYAPSYSPEQQLGTIFNTNLSFFPSIILDFQHRVTFIQYYKIRSF